MQILMIVS